MLRLILSTGVIAGGLAASLWFFTDHGSPEDSNATPRTAAMVEDVAAPVEESVRIAQPKVEPKPEADQTVQTAPVPVTVDPSTLAEPAPSEQQQYGPWTLLKDGTLITQRWVEVRRNDGTVEPKLVTMRATPRFTDQPARPIADRMREQMEKGRRHREQTPR